MVAEGRPGWQMLATTLLLLVAACNGESPRCGDESTSASLPAGTTAPTSASPEPDCANPSIRLGPVLKHDVLTEVADAVTIKSANGGPLTASLRPVRRYTAQVVAHGHAPPELVYEAFTKQVGPELPKLGETVPHSDGTATVHGRGRFVRLAGVTAIEAPFTYRCGDAVIHGVASSWLIPISAIIDCDRPRHPKRRMYREAAALACTN